MKYAVALILLLVSQLSWATINFVEVTPISLSSKNDTIIFEFKDKGSSKIKVLEISRRMECLSSGNTLGKNTQGEFESAKRLLVKYSQGGEDFKFGLNALSVPNTKNRFWAVNLKVFAPKGRHPIVQSISSDVGGKHCAYISS